MIYISIACVLCCTACNKTDSYDWQNVDLLMETTGEESNSYTTDGSPVMFGKKIDIYYHKDAEAETFIRLQKWYDDIGDDYYTLIFDKHYYQLVDHYIVTVKYSCSYHYNTEYSYQFETVGLNYFKGEEETFDQFYRHIFCMVENKKMQDGKFLSCDFNEQPIFGFEKDGNFSFPYDLNTYWNDLMSFGFEKTTEFLTQNQIELFY